MIIQNIQTFEHFLATCTNVKNKAVLILQKFGSTYEIINKMKCDTANKNVAVNWFCKNMALLVKVLTKLNAAWPHFLQA